MGSSWIRAQNPRPCIGRWILNHCATREVPSIHLWLQFLIILSYSCVIFIYISTHLIYTLMYLCMCFNPKATITWNTKTKARVLIVMHFTFILRALVQLVQLLKRKIRGKNWKEKGKIIIMCSQCYLFRRPKTMSSKMFKTKEISLRCPSTKLLLKSQLSSSTQIIINSFRI